MSGDELLGVGEAQAWLAAHWPPAAARSVPLPEAIGRVAAADVTADDPWPPQPSAREHGVAVLAADTQGAGVYSPVRLSWSQGRAHRIAAGEALPPGCDAVVPAGIAAVDEQGVSLTAPAAAGEGVRRAGADVAAGDRLLAAGQRPGPLEAARLAALGIGELACRELLPVTLTVVEGAATASVARTLVARLLPVPGTEVRIADGGIEAVLAADAPPGLVLALGGSGEAPDDPLAGALAWHGGLVARGVAMQPGLGTRLGQVRERRVIGLPGQPWPAFCALWLLLGGRLGLNPLGSGAAPLGRKLSSPLGVTELVPLAREGAGVVPLPRDAVLPPARLVGVVTVPEESEGHAAGETVTVHWLEERVHG